jgi:hypothetical protein
VNGKGDREKDTNYTGLGGKGFGNIQAVKKGVS